MPDQEDLVSVEKDGRILSGVGVEESDLASTMDRHAPPSTGDAPAAPPPGPKPTRGQKRFDQLTGEREEARRRADAAESRAKDLEAQLAAATTSRSTPPPSAHTPPPTAPPPAPSASASPNGFPKFEVWFQQHPQQDFDDYLNARDAFTMQAYGYVRQTDLDASIRKSIEADRETRSRSEREGQEMARGRSVYPDFDAVVSAPHLMTNNWPQYLIDAINAQEQPEHYKYALGKDPVLAERIRTMNPVFAGPELAKLVPSAAVAQRPASTARTMTSPPPAPYQPVAGGGKTQAPSSADLAMRASDYEYDKSGYREQRAKERGTTRRR